MKCEINYNLFDLLTKKEHCSKCKSKSVIYLSYANQHLCGKHFSEMFERRFKSTVREFKMIKKGERIALGLSGGKDSTTLLHLLNNLKKALPFELVTITVDFGVRCDYSIKTLNTAKRETLALGIEHHVVTFKDEIGYTLGELIEKTKTNIPCSYCGVIRRRILNKKARELNATKMVIGHTLDDTVQTVLMNLMRNEPFRLLRYMEPLIKDEELVPRIRPLISSPENEVVAYGKLKGLKLEEKSCCPYSKNAMRGLVREELNVLEVAYPGTKIKMFRSFLAIQDMMRDVVKDKKFEFEYCKKCGEPGSAKECMYCNMLSKINSA